MMAEVVGAVSNPMPKLITIIGQAMSQYVESTSTHRRKKKPAAISARPVKTTRRSPTRGRYQNDVADSTRMGPMIGASDIAVLIGL